MPKLIKRPLAKLRCESGQAIVEFALVLPILILFLFGIVDLGRAFNEWISDTHLANQAARLETVDSSLAGGTPATLASYLKTQPEWQTGAQVCIAFPNTTSKAGDPVQVQVQNTYRFLPFIPSNVTGSASLTGSATMRLEQAATFSAGCST